MRKTSEETSLVGTVASITSEVRIAAEDSRGRIMLQVIGQDGQTFRYKIKNTKKLSSLTEMHRVRMGVVAKNIRFLYEGVRIQPNDTPVKLNMKEMDEIDVYLIQDGGMAQVASSYALHSHR